MLWDGTKLTKVECDENRAEDLLLTVPKLELVRMPKLN